MLAKFNKKSVFLFGLILIFLFFSYRTLADENISPEVNPKANPQVGSPVNPQVTQPVNPQINTQVNQPVGQQPSPQETLNKIMQQASLMRVDFSQYAKYAESIKGCKAGKFTLADPMAIQSLVRAYLTKGAVTDEEANRIAHQNDVNYVIIGMKDKKCHYTMTTLMQPNKTWQCTISEEELVKLSNFFKTVADNQGNIEKIPSFPPVTQECR